MSTSSSFQKTSFDYNSLLPHIDMTLSAKFGSRARYARYANMNEANLSRIFNYRQEMSVGTFIRICVDLELGEFKDYFIKLTDNTSQKDCKFLDTMPLSVFFNINQSKIMQSFMCFI